MVIESFQFSGQGPLVSVECNEVPPIMIIAGPNGVGKSTLLEKIREGATGESFGTSRVNHVRRSDETGIYCLYYPPHRYPIREVVSLKDLLNRDRLDFKEALARSHTGGYRPNYGDSRERSRLVGDATPYLAVKRRMAEFKFERRDLLEKIYERDEEQLLDSVPDLIEPFQTAIQNVLPHLTFIDITIDDEDTYSLKFEDQNENIVNFDELSSGERDAISILFFAVESEITEMYTDVRDDPIDKRDLVILVDGPDQYLHPDLQRRLIQFLNNHLMESENKGRRIQIIMTTHSKAIIDTVSRESIYFLESPTSDDSNQLHSVDSLNDKMISDIMGEMGLLALSSGRHLLLVEGKSDRDVISILYPKIEQEFTIIPMGGRDRIQEMTTFNKVVSELVTSGREVFGILDRDRGIEMPDCLQDRIHILDYTCMENIVIYPQGIYEAAKVWIKPSQLRGRGIESPDDIEDLIADIISDDEFKQEEIWTRFNEEFNPINLSRKEFDHRPEENFEDYAIKEVRSNLEDTRKLSEIEQEVQFLIDRRNLAELDGKEIMKRISNKFNISQERMVRIVAREMKDNNSKPDKLTNFMKDIHSRVT